MPRTAEPRSLTSLREKLIKIGALIISHGRYVMLQMAEVTVPRQIFADILSLIARLRAPPAPARVWQATKGEACLGTGKATRFSAPFPSTYRFDRLLVAAKAVYHSPSRSKRDPGSNSPGIWRMSDKVSEANTKGCPR